MWRALVVLFALSFAGCEAVVTEVELAEIDFDYGFLVVADESGAPKRVMPMFDPSGRSLPGLALNSDESRFFLVTFTREDLRQAFPAFDESRLQKLELKRGAAPMEPTYEDITDAVDTRMRARLPDATQVFAGPARAGVALDLAGLEPLSLDASRLRPELELFVPVVDGYCRNNAQSELRPFAATADAVKAARGPLGVRQLHWVDDDRLLLVASGEVVVVERGQPFVDSSTSAVWKSWLHMSEVVPTPREREQLAAATLDPAIEPDGRRRIWITGGVAPHESDDDVPTPSWLRSAWLTDEGMAWTDEPPVAIDNFPRTLEFREDGALLVGTHQGKAFVRTSSTFEPLEPSPPTFVENDDDYYWFRRTGHEGQPMIASTKAAIHVYDAQRARWDSDELVQSRILSAEPIKFFGLDSVIRESGDLSIFASTQNGGVFWRLDRLAPWEQPELQYPPSFRPCAAAGELAYGRHPIHAIEVQDGYVFMAYALCTSMVVMPLPTEVGETPCLYLLHEQPEDLGEAGVARVVDHGDARVAIATRPGAAAMATALGSIYVSEW